MSLWLWQRRTSVDNTICHFEVYWCRRSWERKKFCFCLVEWGTLWNALPLRWCCSFKPVQIWINKKAQVPFHFKMFYTLFGGFGEHSFSLPLLLRQVREGSKVHVTTYGEEWKSTGSTRAPSLRAPTQPHCLPDRPAPHLPSGGNHRSLLTSLGFCKDKIRWFIWNHW